MSTFVQNDLEDRQRMFYVLSGLAGAALGVDPGPGAWDGPLNNPAGRSQVLSVTTGTAPEGRAATISGNIAGFQFSLPLLLVLGAGAFLLLRK